MGSFSESWGSGNLTHASAALAEVSVDGVSTTRRITIGLVHSTGGVPGVHRCGAWIGHGIDGVLGIRADPASGLTNPLAALPARYTQSWSVSLSSSGGTLELAAPIPAHPTAAFALSGVAPGDSIPTSGTVPTPARPAGASTSSVTALSQPGSSGVSMETTGSSTMCWQVARDAHRLCVPTVFDTGSTDAVLFSRSGGPPTRVLPAGKAITGGRGASRPTTRWLRLICRRRSDRPWPALCAAIEAVLA